MKLLPVTDRALDYCEKLTAMMRDKRLRVETDTRSEKIGKKIRDAQLEKVPYMLIIGDKEVESGNTVAVRSRSEGDLGTMTAEDFIAKVAKEDREKTVN